MKHLIVLFFFTSLMFAQQVTIKGRVINSSSGQPLYLANIQIEDGVKGTSTDAEGYFELTGDFTNEDILTISYIGFETKKIPAALLSKTAVNEIILESKVITSQTVLVNASLGKKGVTPITFSDITRKEIEESYINQDIPEYLSYMPSTTFYSEGGAGLGYNYISIRGFGQRRVSISVNGIPQNEPEDHNVYWLDMPDLLASAELIQVQRGAGSGVIGYPAIGGSINIITSAFSDKPKFEASTFYGSYDTRKFSTSYSSGLIEDKYSIYVKLSQTLSGGYRDGNWIDFKSYHVSAARYDEDFTTQINIYGGPVADGLTYTGISKHAIKDKDLRKDNYSYWLADDGEYTYRLPRRGSEKENFSQPHFEILNEYQVNDDVKLNSALFLILGNGFFDYDGSWADTNYLRLTSDNGFNPATNPGNVLIRAMVENKQWGWIPRVSIKHNNGELTVGGEFRMHRSVHWGGINYGENLPAGLTKDFRYYYYEGGKDIINFYAHELYNLNERINLLGEVQVSYNKYLIENERYLDNEFEISNVFINPRFGINYKFTPEFSGYFTVARVSREPRLKTYYDAAESSGGAAPQFEVDDSGNYDFDNPLVEPETMNSIELGTVYERDDLLLSANAFYMMFDDEIASQGQIDRFGQPITGNIEKTIHTGIELSGTAKLNDNFEITLNGSYSKNFVSEGKTFITYDFENGDTRAVEIDLADNNIAGFPEVTFNAIVKYRNEGFLAQFFAKYVGEFYSDNYYDNLSSLLEEYPRIIGYDDNLVESYFVANMIASYDFGLNPYFKNVRLFVQVNNIFDKLYASYAIGREFFPAAERNFLAGLTVGF